MPVTLVDHAGTRVKMAFDSSSNSTAERDIFLGSRRVVTVEVDNTSGARVYTKFWDKKTPTVGTDAPDYVLPTAASTRTAHSFLEIASNGSTLAGVLFSSGVSLATVTAGGTGGTTSPAATVRVRIMAT